MTSQLNSANHFLASLSARDSELIKPHLRPLELPQQAILYKAEGDTSICQDCIVEADNILRGYENTLHEMGMEE
jgi:hypothetical protein